MAACRVVKEYVAENAPGQAHSQQRTLTQHDMWLGVRRTTHT